MICLTVVVLLAVLDLGLKWLIEKQKPEDFPRPLQHTKEKILLYRNHNAGFPFGVLEQYGELVRVFPLIVISALGGVLCYLIPRRGHAGEKIGLTVLLGGALSNLYDRYVRRYVVDYFSIQIGFLKKVVFNLGDIFVFLGAGILAAREIWQEIHEKCHHE